MPLAEPYKSIKAVTADVMDPSPWSDKDIIDPPRDFPEEMASLCSPHDVPFYGLYALQAKGLLRASVVGSIRSSEDAFMTYATDKLLPNFCDGTAESKNEMEITAARLTAVWRSCRSLIKEVDENNAKAAFDPNAPVLVLDPAIRDKKMQEFIDKHVDLDLKEFDFLAPEVCAILRGFQQRKLWMHLVIDQLLTADLIVKCVQAKVEDEKGITKLRKGCVIPKNVFQEADLHRRVRAFFFELHIMGIVDWETLGRFWIKSMRDFCTEYNPTFEDLVFFDHATRAEVCKLQRTQKKAYPTIFSAFKHVHTAMFGKFMNLAVNRRQGGTVTDPMRLMTYPIPNVESTIPSALRSESSSAQRRADDDAPGDSSSKTKTTNSARKMQSQMDRLRNQINNLQKGNGKGRFQRFQNQKKGMRKAKGKGRGKNRRKGNKRPREEEDDDDDDEEKPPKKTKTQKERVPDPEMKRIQKAVKSSKVEIPSTCKIKRFCWFAHSSKGCNQGTKCQYCHLCPECGADHCFVEHH